MCHYRFTAIQQKRITLQHTDPTTFPFMKLMCWSVFDVTSRWVKLLKSKRFVLASFTPVFSLQWHVKKSTAASLRLGRLRDNQLPKCVNSHNMSELHNELWLQTVKVWINTESKLQLKKNYDTII